MMWDRVRADRVPFWGHFSVAHGDVLLDDFVVGVVLPGRFQFNTESHDLRPGVAKIVCQLVCRFLRQAD